MDTLIYLDNTEDLADYGRFSVERDPASPFWYVMGWKKEESTKIAEFITYRHASLFRSLCESTAKLRQIVTGARNMRGSSCAA